METLLIQGFVVLAIISGLPLILSTLIGLVLSVFQTSVQVQEQSLGFLIKVCTVFGVLFVCRAWFEGQLVELFQLSLESVLYLG